MPCFCATNSLRLFVRSISQVELPAAVSQASRSQFYNTCSIRRCALNRSVRFQHSSSRGAATSTLSNVTHPDGRDTVEVASSAEHNAPIVSKKLLREAESIPGEAREQDNDVATQIASHDDSAFMELSQESIDVLSTEIELQARNRSRRRPTKASNISQELQSSKSFNNAKERQDDTVMRSISLGGPSRTGKHEKSRFNLENEVQGTREKEDRWVTRQDQRPQREHWQIQKEALKKKFPEGWNPKKRLSPDALMGIRALHAQMPEQCTTETLAKTFQVSVEAIRRILKSNWTADADEEADRQSRWFRRGERVWSRYAELGVKPPKKWRELGIGRGRPDKKKPPVLVTTSTRPPEAKEGKAEGGSLADRIL
ncbi:hypothetical protein F5884DRAFT_284006 [Xylogone sp. PMI_703]|nr:hypothetical protein F5884DRAFT_284006 [Xylogone sp. PMI_703]